jgi:hypothetical protein
VFAVFAEGNYRISTSPPFDKWRCREWNYLGHHFSEKWRLPQPQEKTSQPATELPNPELNPLLNPTLGQNLGRWAQVYFTSPPEKREEAVLELLAELRAQAGENEAPPSDQSAAPAWLNQGVNARMAPEGVRCAECGHQNAKKQRFCGMCGASLILDKAVAGQSGAQNPGTQPSARPESVAESASPASDSPFPVLSLFASVSPEPRGAPTGEATSGRQGLADVQWLSDPGLGSGEQSHSLKYVLAILVVLLVGVFFYAQTRSQRLRATDSTPASGSAPASSTQPAPASTQPPPASPPTAAPAVAQSGDASENATKPEASNSRPAPVPRRALQPVRSAPAPSAFRSAWRAQAEDASSSANGAAELTTAENYLTGKRGARDSAEAAKLLWRAVGKHNVTAALLLSDLYRTGDGVPKSCDQARLLLDAAAQRNSIQAANKLRELQSSGCQ